MRRSTLPLLVLSLACGTAQSVRPLGAGRSAVDVSLGGPLIRPLGDVPPPQLLVGYRRGLDDRSDAFGRLHFVPAAIGLVGLEVGASRLVLGQDGLVPAVSASAHGLLFAGRGGAFAVPALSTTASWMAGRWLLYAGTELAVSFGEQLEGGGAAVHWAPYLGATRALGRWTVGLEVRWWEPHLGDDVLVWYQGIGGRGAIAPMIALERRIGADP